MSTQIRIGISGWQYDGWRGDFYPEQLPKRRQLAYAAHVLNSIEINGTYYSLKSPRVFDEWREQTPADFVFAVKGSRYITQMRRLRDPLVGLANFFANGVLRLGPKLGPILWQLPPRMDWDADAFGRFCQTLPATMHDAARIAAKHDERVNGRAWFDTDSKQPIRHAFEIRDDRMMNDQLVRILREHNHALVFADSTGKYPYAEDVTAGFIYIRLHGEEELYTSGYDGASLEWWRQRIDKWTHGEQPNAGPRLSGTKPPRRKHRDVYVYFDNDAKHHAPFDALSLARKLGAYDEPGQVTLKDGRTFAAPPRLAAG